jgi:hypothetical protein
MGEGNFAACFAKVFAAPAQKRERTASAVDLAAGTSPPVCTTQPVAVVIRQQTGDEQRRFEAATDALPVELVRRRLGRGR